MECKVERTAAGLPARGKQVPKQFAQRDDGSFWFQVSSFKFGRAPVYRDLRVGGIVPADPLPPPAPEESKSVQNNPEIVQNNRNALQNNRNALQNNRGMNRL